MQVTKTSRGFERVDFADANGQACSLQQSSAIDTSEPYSIDRPGTSMLWLGVDEVVPKTLVYGQGWTPIQLPDHAMTAGRMHLTRSQVVVLVEKLQAWLATGSLEGGER